MGTIVGSLGNKNQETSSSESPSWVEALTDWKGDHRGQEPTGFFPWTYGLHNLSSTKFLMSYKTCLQISKDTREYNSFCAWVSPLQTEKSLFLPFIRQFHLIQLHDPFLSQGHVCKTWYSSGHWWLQRKGKSSFPFPATCSRIYAVLRQHQLSSCPRAAYISW